ncbi:long-chain-fatty-acid--CoA ligase [Streptomyces zaomyceticus]|uniref:long-chain-fatty-acid--CoA ligase n=1 Tax=Streptomyces zaomyceticus TaxID=68286 RepID=UPI003428427A
MYMTQGLHRAVQQRPDQVMTVFGLRKRTFREVADRVARLAGALRGLGVHDGDRVAMLSLNSDRYNEYLLAVPWAGAVLNPVNTRWSVQEIAYSLCDSDTRVLLVDDAFAPMAPALQESCPELMTVIHAGDGPAPPGTLDYEEILASSDPMADRRRGGDELAGIFYTGGTTGFPKGVMLSHANLGTSWLGSAAGGDLCGPDSRTLHVAPMFHLADLLSWGLTLLSGGTQVIMPSFEPRAVLGAIAEHRVTDALLVPTMIQMLADHPDVGRCDLRSLRRVLYGASPITPAVLRRAMKAFPDASFTQAYGMTELAPVATLLSPSDHAGERLMSAGRAAPHAEIRIVDADGTPLPTGAVGEVTVRGGNVMLGYWNKPEDTAAALRDGWMRTGDVGHLDEAGYLYIVDRIKDMIVTGGENVYSAEVEAALASHPAVAQCAVIGVPDPDWGERVHAVVVVHPGADVTIGELRAHAKTLVAGYKAPRSLEIVDMLPVSGTGKVLKRDLRTRHWGGSDRGVS